MKKRFCMIFLLCIMLAGCSEKPGETTPTTEPAPTTKTVYVHASIIKEFGSAVSRTEFVFDEQDHVTEVVVYSNDTEQMRYAVECDENGNYVRWSSTGGNMDSYTEYAYDEHGHSLGSTVYIGGNVISSTKYDWEDGKQTAVITTMPAQDMEQRAAMTYDEQNRLTRQDTYVNGALTGYSIFTSDESGRITTAAAYQSDGTAVSVTAYTYDGATEIRTTTDAVSGTVTQTTHLTYDEQGNLLTSAVYDGENRLVSREAHTWKAVVVPPDCPRASV